MKANKKARQLVEQFIAHTYCKNNSELQCKDKSKQCALIAVDEILNDDWYITSFDEMIERKKYWEQVKQEIINL